MFKKIFIVSIIFSLTSIACAEGDEVSGSSAFTQLKTLVGTWEKEKDSGVEFNISFELTANNTVLIETWLHSGRKRSLTLYHADGEHLIATHYCPQGNQPRLRLSKNSSLDDLSFDYFDSTNLESLSDSHQHSLRFEFSKDNDLLRRSESYLSGSGEDASELVLVRVKG